MVETPFDIDVRADGPRIVLALRGELDLATVGTLQSCVGSLDHEARLVVLDLTDLTFIDSSGIAALVEAHRQLESEGRALTLSNPRGAVAKVFDLTALATVLTVDVPDLRGPQR